MLLQIGEKRKRSRVGISIRHEGKIKQESCKHQHGHPAVTKLQHLGGVRSLQILNARTAGTPEVEEGEGGRMSE